MMARPYGIALGVFLCFLFGALIYGIIWNNEKSKQIHNVTRTVKLIRAGKDFSRKTWYPGKAQSASRAKLFFRVSGPIIEHKLRLGQLVSTGEVLMSIDPRDYEKNVENLARELQTIEELNRLANLEYERQKKLLRTKAISQSNFDETETAKRASDAQVAKLQVNLNQAKDKLNDTKLRAPFSGRISAIYVEEHEAAEAYRPVAELDDTEHMEIVLQIPDRDFSYVSERLFADKSLSFDVRIPQSKILFQAHLTELSPKAAAGKESYEAVLLLEKSKNFPILPGMSVEASLLRQVPETPENIYSLPFSAVINRENESFVFVYNAGNNTVEKRKVTAIGPAGENSIFVEGDIDSQKYIVAAGGDWLTEGSSVSILNPEELDGSVR